ncbi:MAG: recombinase family protein, partial [Alphaproteobacteria bacterium]|nr:recombinase family protein [Alphaproteobacteria bacterium]
MKKKKCLLFFRVSTTKQEWESQLKETKLYAESLGFNDFVTVGKAGASAYKVADEYLALVDEMKGLIERDNTIEAVITYHLNRLCRNDKVAMDIKEFLIKHHTNLYVYEPTIKLLNDDGSINTGAELAFSLFATMSRQQIDELIVKSKRGKNAKKAM